MSKKVFAKVIILLSTLIFFLTSNNKTLSAQVTGPQEIKWLRIGSLHQWISNGGAEIEYGRRGRTFLATDQMDGLIYPAQFTFQDHNVGKSLWIGTTNFEDPVQGETYPYKVVCAGRLFMYLNEEIYPQDLLLYGKFDHPQVYVDDLIATDLNLNDIVDEVYPNLNVDRMIVNRFHTTIGVSCTRKIYAFSQQYNDNYFIYEYTFKNTGIIDDEGTTINRTLTDVIFHFQYRYGFGYEAFRRGWGNTGQSWGLNTINDAVGQNQDPNVSDPELRAVYAYYGPHSATNSFEEDFGNPNYVTGYVLAGTQHAGTVVLHADNPDGSGSDDASQPMTTQYMGSDRDAQAVNQYNADLMRRKYEFMTAGHPDRTHAEAVGTQFADDWTDDPGGISSAQGFGPYTLAPGDSVRIVLAEAIAGIDRQTNKTVAFNWFNNNAPFTLPDGSTTNDRNEYKNVYVRSGVDSLFQSFRRALNAYENDYTIPGPPPPPSEFYVNSGGDRITLNWVPPENLPNNFDGYDIYRAVGRPDTTYSLIYSGGPDVTTFNDKSARRGFDYYYYIVSKDDGSTNNIQPGVPLVSSKYYTMTNQPAYLRRPAGTALSKIRVVPNPYNIKARKIQFGIDSPDRLAFYGLPGACTIKIFTERGDLINTIEHTDGSGDELWDSLTSSRQLVVSGVYIAYFEVTEDIYEDPTDTEPILKKGDNTFRKFVIVR